MIPEREPTNNVKNEYIKKDLIIKDASFFVGKVDKYTHNISGVNSPILTKIDGRKELKDV